MEFEDEVGIYYRSSYKPSIKKEVDETATSEIHGEVEEEVDGVERRLKELKNFDKLPNPPFNHHFINKPYNIQASLAERIQGEWESIRQLPPSSILVRGYTSRIDLMRAVIVGGGDFIRLPKRDKIKILGRKGVVIVDDDREDDEMITCQEGPPYHQGLFFFDIFFPSDYPTQPPQLFFRSHGLDLNPNLPKNGKVLLDANLQQSNIWYTLVSIRELILVDGIDRDREIFEIKQKGFCANLGSHAAYVGVPTYPFSSFSFGVFSSKISSDSTRLQSLCRCSGSGDEVVILQACEGL